jgi:transposase
MNKQISMNVVNPRAAGIDVGSRSHYVAIGQLPQQIREFGVYTQDQKDLITWLRQNKVTTVAMESTGSYWQTLFSHLQLAGFDVILVNGKQIKNVKGKTDVKDCQWIQRLHSLGLLTGSFLPSSQIEQLRTFQRHRSWMVEQCAKLSNKMQKALRLMNIRLDVVLRDVTGKSGLAIIKAILDGERSAEKLAALADGRVRKSKAEIVGALNGQWQLGLLFELKDCYDLYFNYQRRMEECDCQIEALLQQLPPKDNKYECPHEKLTKKKVYKNQQKVDMPNLSYRYTGVDLFAIDGVSHNTIITFISEVGMDLFKFKTSKQFVNWLRFAPNNKITGGQIVSSRTPKGKSKLAIALRNAANSIGQMRNGPLKRFFDRIAYKKGRAAAINATARKLAIIIWNMIVHQQPYKPMDETLYNDKIKASVIQNINKKMNRMHLSVNDLLIQQNKS